MTAKDSNAIRAAVWRQRAAKLRALARTTSREKERAELTALAEQWDAMALLAEKGDSGSSCPGGEGPHSHGHLPQQSWDSATLNTRRE